MTSVPADASEQIRQLRQQLILAQVRIMELEDGRESLTPRIDELERLLQAAQTLADRKADEANHLARVLAEAQERGASLQAQLDQAAATVTTTAARLGQSEDQVGRLKAELAQARQESDTRLADSEILAAELAGVRASRSWRWTSWLRSLGRWVGLKQA